MGSKGQAQKAVPGLYRQTWKLFWRHRGLFWTLAFIYQGVMFLYTAAGKYLAIDTIFGDVVGYIFLYNWVFVFGFGNLHVSQMVWRRKKAGITAAFVYFQDAKSFARTLVMGIVMQLHLIAIALYMRFVTAQSVIAAVVSLIVLLLMIVAAIWYSKRIYVLPYLYADSPNAKLGSLIKASFQITKGKVWRIIGIEAGFDCMVLPLLIMLVITANEWFGVDSFQQGTVQLGYSLVTSIIIALTIPYYWLVMTGYAKRLMSEDTTING